MKTKKFAVALLALAVSQSVQAQMVPEIKPGDMDAEFIEAMMERPPVQLTEKEKAALKYVREWKNNPDKPAPAEDGGIVYMFGTTLPTLLCAKGKACAIYMEPGELINDVGSGDQARIELDAGKIGDRQVVIVKPRTSGVTTNLIINTDRRGYTVLVKTTRSEFMPYLKFVYPEDTSRMLAKFRAEKAVEQRNSTMRNGRPIGKLDFNYRISGDNPKWKPIRVYNDGRQMTIQFPSAHFEHGAPALAGLTSSGGVFSDPEYETVNYRTDPDTGDTYIVDRLLDHAVLVVGAGKNQVRVNIEHTGGKK